MSIDSANASATSLPLTSGTASSSPSVPNFINPYATVTVRSHVPLILDLKTPNYSKWSSFFTSMCSKFGLMAHIDDTASRPDDTTWVQADYCVRSWLFGSVTDDVL